MKITRREFVKFGLVSTAAVSMTACGRPVEHGLVSQYQMPEYTLPGEPLFWASHCTESRADCAVSVKTVQGRAIYVAGMPHHPFSKGKVNSEVISSLQALYNPGRISQAKKSNRNLDAPSYSEMGDPVGALTSVSKKLKKAKPLFIVDRIAGSQGGLLCEMAKATNGKIWVRDDENSLLERRILKSVTGKAELPFYEIEKADYIVSFASDFLSQGYTSTRNSWAYGRFRQTPGRLRGTMVSFSSRMTTTDIAADGWMAVSGDSEVFAALALAHELKENGVSVELPSWAGSYDIDKCCELCAQDKEVFVRLAKALVKAKQPLLIPASPIGENAVALNHLVHSMSKALTGEVVTYEPDGVRLASSVDASLFVSTEDALKHMDSCKAVVIVDCDPVFQVPKSTKFTEKLAKIRNVVALSPFLNSTTALASLTIPTTTWMESWGDQILKWPGGEAFMIQQPVVSSIWNQKGAEGRSAIGMLDALLHLAKGMGVSSVSATSGRELVQSDVDDKSWRRMLARAGVWDVVNEDLYPNWAANPPAPLSNKGSVPASVNPYDSLVALTPSSVHAPKGAKGSFQFLPFLTNIGNGRMANRPWMQELPDSMTTVVWDSWIELNESEARDLGLARNSLVQVTTSGGQSFEASVYPSPSLAPGQIAMPQGRGHGELYGRWATSGVNPLAYVEGAFDPYGEPEFSATSVTVKDLNKAKLLTTFDSRVFDLPRHIFPD